MSLPKPVSPEINPVNPSAAEDEESLGGGSDDELTDVEDVFVEEEAKRLNVFVVRRGLVRRRLIYITVLTSLTAVGAPTAREERPGGGTAGEGDGM